MTHFPRVAIGAVQPHADPQPVVCCVIAALASHGLQVQPFQPQSFLMSGAASFAAGCESRHLDTWQMTRGTCRDLLAHAAKSADIAIVWGQFDTPRSGHGGSLTQLCQWLDIPRIGVLDIRQLASGLPAGLPDLDAIILDHAMDAAEAARWAVELEVRGLRAIGWLPAAPALRARLRQHEEGSSGAFGLGKVLTAAMSRRLRVDQMLTLAQQSCRLPACDEPLPVPKSNIGVALAYDDAFHRYFPDMLDQIEATGARIRTFSPLRDEGLPAGCDLVLIGCGNIVRWSDTLAGNHCMHLALRRHLRSGGRIYGEGCGAAYLCQSLTLDDGVVLPMTGLLRATANWSRVSNPMQPLETWWKGPGVKTLESRPVRVRGYRNASWTLRPLDQPDASRDCLHQDGAMASRVHVNLAASPRLLEQFLGDAVAV